MYKHHRDAIDKATEKLKIRDDVLSVIVSGSIARGVETEFSDVDLIIVISDDDYTKKLETRDLFYHETESCSYEGGYIDGKYICLDFMRKVEQFGSEPAKFAFKDSIITYSKIDGLQDLLNNITAYPIMHKQENINRFYSQFVCWKWYCKEALKSKNEYLLMYSISNLVLFGGRLLLAYNETLYPFHKWFSKIIETLKFKPDNIMKLMSNVIEKKDNETIDAFYKSIRGFTVWNVTNIDTSSQFVIDSELGWLYGKDSVADI